MGSACHQSIFTSKLLYAKNVTQESEGIIITVVKARKVTYSVLLLCNNILPSIQQGYKNALHYYNNHICCEHTKEGKVIAQCQKADEGIKTKARKCPEKGKSVN